MAQLPGSAQPIQGCQGAAPVVFNVGEGVHAQVAGRCEPGIDPVAAAPLADPVHDLVSCLCNAECVLRPIPLGQIGEVLPPAVQEAAVATARAATADVCLQQDDPRLR